MRVMLLTRTGDPESVLARLFLQGHRIPFAERHVDEAGFGLGETGAPRRGHVPVLFVDGEPLVGFDPPRLAGVLRDCRRARRALRGAGHA